eukprot:gene19146-24985_t
MTAEYGCPKFAWAGDCLGPSGNWSVWTIYNGKLYFFLMDSVKEYFLEDPEGYIANGDLRWAGWFSDSSESKYKDECDCPDNVKTLECSDTSYPVLGGVDFVNYFTKYKTSDGLVDETQTGELGSIDYSSVYNGYTFYFTSAANKELFDQSPSSYIPQYGGFCSWGIVAEYGCPRFPWSNDCLGPNGNWSVWTIYNGKIYFFLMDKVKDSFLLDPASYVANGDERWAGWFSNEPTFSTKCYSN